MKTPFFLVAGLIFGLVVIGIATLHSSLLTLAIPLMAYMFAAIYQRPEAIKLTVKRELSHDFAPQGTPITVKMAVINQGMAIDELIVNDIFPAGVTKTDGTSSAARIVAAQGGLADASKVELEYTIEAHRGEYSDYETLIYARDFSGCFEQALVYRTSPRLTVHPRYPKLDRIKIRPPQTRGFAGPIAARQGGTGIDFWSVREYQSGDPPRQINWKLSARAERDLYTNIYEQERVADVGIIVDARQRTNVVTPSGSLFDHSVRAAASLAENFLDDGNRVSLLMYGSGLLRVFPGYGRVQQDLILKALAKATTAVNFALENLNELPTRLFPAKSQIVLISPLMPEDTPVIVRMRAHGYSVIVISPDPVAYESLYYKDLSSPAYRIASAERRLMLRRVRASGAQIVDWSVDHPLEITVREALARQSVAAHQLRISI
ncbi:MAG: DUF58 domain-containing protein [Chloroflexota bacterium]